MKLRADAQRNLDRLLAAAAECFAEHGVEVSIDEIARRAGVGHGTVFRRFPTKDALLGAVIAERVRELAELAGAAVEQADVLAALEGFVRQAAEVYAANRALIEGIARCQKTNEVDDLLRAVRALVRRSHAAGVLRYDVSAEDLLMLVPIASQYPEVILNGLRPPAAVPVS